MRDQEIANRIPAKRVRFFRISDSMWEELNRLAAPREMSASEYVRRIVENHLRRMAAKIKKED